jgi:hypothetical protein
MTGGSVGIVVPAYQPDISRLQQYIKAINKNISPNTIIIEIDSPEKDTERQFSDIPARVETVPYRRGKGAAVTEGFEKLETDTFAFADADGATPTDSLADVIRPVQMSSADLSVGSRRHPRSDIDVDQTIVRQFLGSGFTWLAKTILPIKLFDYQCGAKAISANCWDKVREHLYESGFAWDIELIAIAGALDSQIKEVPIKWKDRPGSTVDPVWDSINLFKTLIIARHRAKQLSGDWFHKSVS